MKTHLKDPNADFTCKHCRRYVSSNLLLAGVRNRNHCPYCLWSRHLDLWQAGDRLSACKGAMRPVALTLKATRKKYAPGRGELMLVHRCEECGRLSLNRIAADDDAEIVISLVEHPLRLGAEADGIILLSPGEREVVLRQLFGAVSVP